MRQFTLLCPLADIKTNLSDLKEVDNDEGPVDSAPLFGDSPFAQQAYYGFVALIRSLQFINKYLILNILIVLKLLKESSVCFIIFLKLLFFTCNNLVAKIYCRNKL